MRTIHYIVKGKNFGMNKEKAEQYAKEINAKVGYKWVSI